MDIEKKCRTLASTGATFRYGPWHPSADGLVVMDRYGEQVARAVSKEDCEALARAPEMAKALLDAANELEQLRAENARLREALTDMLLFDHCGLRGLVHAKAISKRHDGWTVGTVHAMQQVCRQARAALSSDARTEAGK